MNDRFIQYTYRQVIDTIQQRDVDVSELAQAVVQSALIGEYLLKIVLRGINPLAPYKLDYLKRAHLDFAALVRGEDVSSSLRYEDIGVLLDRAKALGVLDDRVIDLISKIKADRNTITHDPDHEFDKWEAQARLIKLFVNNRELFEKHLSLVISEADLSKVNSALKTTEQRIANRLDNIIRSTRDEFNKLSEADQQERIDEGYGDISAEGSVIDDMFCPSCKNLTLHYLFTVDFDWNPDGVITSGSTWFECHACGLTMSEYDFEDLYDNPRKYAGINKPHPTWDEYYSYKDLQENAYEYM